LNVDISTTSPFDSRSAYAPGAHYRVCTAATAPKFLADSCRWVANVAKRMERVRRRLFALDEAYETHPAYQPKLDQMPLFTKVYLTTVGMLHRRGGSSYPTNMSRTQVLFEAMSLEFDALQGYLRPQGGFLY